VALLQIVVAASILAASPVRTTLTAPGHSPAVNTRWHYSVHVTKAGKPVAAKLTVQIVDPIGGAHPVTFGATTKTIKNWPFTGVFRDYIIWPKSSRGLPLKLRLTVHADRTTKVLTYAVTAHA
jgi:hypothetical protein